MRPLLALGLSLGATIATATAADAHATRLHAPGGGGHADVAASHRAITACDSRPDGRPVYAVWVLQGGGVQYSIVDRPGGGCTNTQTGVIVKYAVCKGLYNCTGWRGV